MSWIRRLMRREEPAQADGPPAEADSEADSGKAAADWSAALDDGGKSDAEDEGESATADWVDALKEPERRAGTSSEGDWADAMTEPVETAAEVAANEHRSGAGGAPALDREALIRQAMTHWARGHAIFERLDPDIKEQVREAAEQMAPK